MPRWLWFAPLAGLTALLALGLYRLSGWAVNLTETDVIELAAEQYYKDAAADGIVSNRATDCVARPGAGAVWITVTCVSEARRYVYDLDRAGRFLSPDPLGPRT
jgi:hypothetical protein